uniref:Calcium channel, voltage-dependent, T type, alpha 1H subunit a n=1 Tax=Takifugu rubripes TaxID=31033 RepID=A0A674NH58_TAKRU
MEAGRPRGDSSPGRDGDWSPEVGEDDDQEPELEVEVGPTLGVRITAPIRDPDCVSEEEEQQPYPALAPVAFFCFKQTMRPRNWLLTLTACTWFEHISMLVILLNCVTLGMFQPCEDISCLSDWCRILQVLDDCIFAFFAVEMVIKMVALGIFGSNCYLGDKWNQLDFVIVMAGVMEYSLDGHNASLSAIRTVRVLRPLRAINRVPSMRILVTLLLDTLPMLGNVLLLCFFVFFIFGIVGVQLWAGLLRNRCFLDDDAFMLPISYFPYTPYYVTEEDSPFICSAPRENGMLRCHDVPAYAEGGVECSAAVGTASVNGCVNWNQYYNVCQPGDHNPHKGAVNFDNIGYAWIAIFQVITLEGWVDIMYYVMDAHSFYNFIYFILLIIVGSFFMINLCLVVIATQFSETKQRENALMREQRARYMSNDSTLASYSEPGSCYEEMLRYISHLYRKLRRRLQRIYAGWHSSSRGCGSLGPGNALWLRPIHNLLQHHQHQHCRLSNGGQHAVAVSAEDVDGGIRGGEELEMSSLPVRRGSTNGNRDNGRNAAVATQGVGTLLGRLNGGMNYPTILPSFLKLILLLDETLPSVPQGGDLRGRRGRGRRQGVLEYRNGVVRAWVGFREKLKRIVESKYFNRGIMIAILVNTLSMGIEYHKQPEELTDILEISNIVFTSMFVLEMGFMLLAFGLFGYIRNPYNIFDSIIVIISVWEIIGQSDGGLSVLRTFRLLRVLKLVRFLPALRRQLVVLMKTMDNVATFCMLLMLFIFTFSILGMHLFGCKFSFRTESGDTIPDRKNFDSLLWAIVTVFQILTQEDWNVVLYNGMASTSPWAALYFVALMTFGNYVLFNLLVAILVEGFQAEVRRIPGYFLVASLISELCNTSSPSRRWRSVFLNALFLVSQALSSPGRRSPLPPRSWGSRRSSWNSLGRAPSLKRRDTSGERESLLSGEGGEEDSGEHVAEVAANNRLWPEPLELLQASTLCRAWCQSVISHKLFDHVVLVFIFLNCITIALERPDIQPHSTERVFLSVSNYVFTVIFLAEMAVKVVALGFCFGTQTYLQSSWNVLDGLLVFVSLVDILVSLAYTGGNRILGILRVLRLLRTLRPLRVISRAPGLKLVVETLITSLRPIGNIVLICCAFFIVFGILGVQLFKGKFYHCEGLDTKNITNKSDCFQANYRWIRRKYNFDNLIQALMTLFVLSCKDGWVNIMYDGLDAVGVDQQPVRNHNPWMLLYFISFLLIVSFFVLNMFVGVVVENFHKCRQDQEEEEARLREEKRLKMIEKKRRNWVAHRHSCSHWLMTISLCAPEAKQRPYYADYSPLRLSIHTLCTSHYLDLFITIIICINVFTMSIEHYNQPQVTVPSWTQHSLRSEVLWNQLDIGIVALSIMGITLEELKLSAALPINPTIIRIMRVLRIARVLKLLKMAKGMRALLDTVMQALPQVGNLGLLFMLLFFIYAALGVELFGKLECNDNNPCEGLSRHATFENFGMAFLTLFRVSTGDNWNGIMKDTLRECRPEDRHCLTYLPWVSPIYFVTFVLMAQFVLVNVVVAVLMKHLEESNKEAKEDAEMDAEIALEMAMEQQQRRSSMASSHSSVEGTYVGPCPHSPGQVGQNTIIISSTRAFIWSWRSVTSVHSQPCESRVLLQVPDVSPAHPRPPLNLTPPRIAPPTSSPSPRSLRRQVRDRVSADFLKRRSFPVAVSVSHITSSAQQRWQDEGAAGQGGRGRTGRSHSLSPFASPHAHDSRSNTSSPLPTLPPSSSRSALSLLGTGSKDRDFKKGFSADNQGFLEKPKPLSAGFPEDQRRHSIEVCLPQDAVMTRDDPHLQRSEKAVQAFPARVQSVGGGHRKKKMSPPCISIHPPSEREHRQMASPPQLADCSTMLRRRTPSYDLTPHAQPSAQDTPTDSPACTPTASPMHAVLSPARIPLTPLRGSTPTPAYSPSTPTHRHIPITPNIFIQPHAPLLPYNTPFLQTNALPPAARHSPLTGECMPRPQFTFDQPQSAYMSGLSDADSATCSSPFDSRLGTGAGFSAKNRRTAQ